MIRIPSWAPGRCRPAGRWAWPAQRTRAGDDQHRDGSGERGGRPPLAGAHPEAEGREPRARSRPARRRRRRGRRGAAPAALPVCASVDEPGDLRERGVRADPGRRGRRAGRRRSRSRRRPRRRAATSTGTRLAGQQRLVDRRARPPRRRRRSRPSRPGRTTKRSPTASCVDRDAPLRAVASSTATSLAPSSSSARSAAPGAPLGAGLEVAAGEDERRRRPTATSR